MRRITNGHVVAAVAAFTLMFQPVSIGFAYSEQDVQNKSERNVKFVRSAELVKPILSLKNSSDESLSIGTSVTEGFVRSILPSFNVVTDSNSKESISPPKSFSDVIRRPKATITFGGLTYDLEVKPETILLVNGLLKYNVYPYLDSKFKAEFHAGATGERADWLQLWLAEFDIARAEPARAIERLSTLIRRTKPNSNVHGIARYDHAFAHYRRGMYRKAVDLFVALRGSNSRGYEILDAIKWEKKISACATLHERNAALGITEPPELDPLCGVSAVAVIQRSMGRDFNQKSLELMVPHNGEGSDDDDISLGCSRLGLNAFPVGTTEKGLRSIPLPVIAHVEHDHFVVVTRVEDSGVTYNCSECGPWPGGFRKVTWKQWRAMEADGYIVVTEPGSVEDAVMRQLEVSDPRPATSPDYIKSDSPLGREALSRVKVLYEELQPETNLWWLIQIECGESPKAPHCLPCPPIEFECATDRQPSPVYGPAAADPVNLATGEEEYLPVPDFEIYNPNGPDVILKRSYYSFSRFQSGFGYSWTHNYNVGADIGLVGLPEYGNYDGAVYFPNRSAVGFTYVGAAPLPGTEVICVTASGIPIQVKWKCELNGQTRLIIEFKDGTKWITSTSRGQDMDYRLIEQEVDRFGNAIKFDYDVFYIPIHDYVTHQTYEYQTRLSRITDESGSALLTFQLDSLGNGTYESATDCYGRTIDYTLTKKTNSDIYARQFYWELTNVSQTNSANTRSVYEYELQWAGHNPVHMLTRILAPSGSGALALAEIDYYDGPLWNVYVKSVTDANGNRREYLWSDPTQKNSVVVRNSADAEQLRYSVLVNTNLQASAYFDALDRMVVELTYGQSLAWYKPTKVRVFHGTSQFRDWEMSYDGVGNLIWSKTPKGTETNYTYSSTIFDPLRKLMEVETAGLTSTCFTYNAYGLVETTQAPIPGQSGTGLRQTSTFTYTPKGNVWTVTTPGNNVVSSHTTTFGYTTDGAYSQVEKFGQPITVSNSAGEISHYRYDTRGNLIKSWDNAGNETTRYYSSTYNVLDQVLESEAPATGTSGTGRSKSKNTYLYPGGPQTKVEVFNENNVLQRTVNYTLGNECEVLSVSGNTEPQTVSYNANYQVTSVMDGNGNTTFYDYNTLGQLTRTRYPNYDPNLPNPEFDAIRFTSFDQAGRLLQRIDGRNKTSNYVYGDLDGQLTEVQYPGSTSENITIGYDSHGRAISLGDSTGTSSTVLDDLGNQTSGTRTYAGLPAKTFTYGYYPDGARQNMATPAGAWSYVYDAAGRSTSTTSPSGTVSYGYLANGWMSDRSLSMGVNTHYDFNPLGMLNFQESNKTVGNEVTLINHYDFTYDGVFNLTGVSTSVPSHSPFNGAQSWTYDLKDRLLSDSSSKMSGYSHSFAYDNAGNPTTFKGVAQTFNSSNQRTATGFAYDGNGNSTTYAGTTCTYDAESRLKQFGGISAYGYRADGLRAWKENLTTESRTYFLYDGGNPVIEMDESGATTAVNDFGADGLTARRNSNGVWTYYVFDNQGSVAQRLNAAGGIIGHQTYDAYGAEWSTGNPQDPWGYNARWGYYFDRDTGKYYCQNRYYDPAQGRWLNRDPIGYSGGMNLYGYCGQGPVGSSDPSGLSTLLGPMLIILADPVVQTNAMIAKNLAKWGQKFEIREDRYFAYWSWDGYESMHWPDQPMPPEFGGDGDCSFDPSLPIAVAVGKGRKKTPLLRAEWEAETGQKWPTHPNGDPYIAHHRIPRADGGADHGSNIDPIPNQQAHIDHHKANDDFSRWAKRARRGGRKRD
jgi:RHS repeat-associated protein